MKWGCGVVKFRAWFVVVPKIGFVCQEQIYNGSRGFKRPLALSLDTSLLEVLQNLIIQVHEMKAAAPGKTSELASDSKRDNKCTVSMNLNYMHWWVWPIKVGMVCGACV